MEFIFTVTGSGSLLLSGQSISFNGQTITFNGSDNGSDGDCIFTLKEGETCTRRTQVLYYLGYI